MDAFRAGQAAWKLNAFGREIATDAQRLALDVSDGNPADLNRAVASIEKMIAGAEKAVDQFKIALGAEPSTKPKETRHAV